MMFRVDLWSLGAPHTLREDLIVLLLHPISIWVYNREYYPQVILRSTILVISQELMMS